MKKINVAICLLLALLSFSANAQNQIVFTTSEGAIGGYDPVAYFREGKPAKGKKEFSMTYQNEHWYFSSAENLSLFQSTPEKYMPEFGGFCAYGMSRGYKAKTEPDAWTIVNGKLYLNYNTEVRDIWNEKQTEYIQKATENWPTVKTTTFKK